jgi:hypothetical protein
MAINNDHLQASFSKPDISFKYLNFLIMNNPNKQALRVERKRDVDLEGTHANEDQDWLQSPAKIVATPNAIMRGFLWNPRAHADFCCLRLDRGCRPHRGPPGPTN